MFNSNSNHNLLGNINNISSEIGNIYNNLNRINNQINQLYQIARNQNQDNYYNNSTSYFGTSPYNYPNGFSSNIFDIRPHNIIRTRPPTPSSNTTNIRRHNNRNRTRNYARAEPLFNTTRPNTTNPRNLMRVPIFESSFSNFPINTNTNRNTTSNIDTNRNTTSNIDTNTTNNSNNNLNQDTPDSELNDVEITFTTENLDTEQRNNDDGDDTYYTETFNLNMNDRNDSLRNILSNLIALRLASQRINRENAETSRLSNLRDINNNTVLEIYKANEDQEEETCVVCREAIEDNSIVRKIKKCGHYFHYKCLDKWLENHLTCPHCRQNIVEETEEESTTLNNSNNNSRDNTSSNRNRNTSHSVSQATMI